MDVNFSKISKILVIRLSSLGDVILTTPLLREIKSLYPRISLHFLVNENYKDVVINNPNLDKIYLYNKDKQIEFNTGFDLVIDLQNNRRSRKIVKSLKSPVVSFTKPQFDKFLLVNFNINRFKKIIPIPVRYASTIPGIEVKAPPEIFTGNISCELINAADKKITIGLAPGSRHFTKMWPEEYFLELSNKLVKTGYKVVIFGGNSDIEIGERIAKKIAGVKNLTNENELLKTVECMKNCSAIVCNDSGMMHTATAAGVPVLAIFGSTVKEFGFVPFSPESIVLENTGLTCRPCSHIGKEECPKKHFRCMIEITPEMVFNNLIKLLEPHD